MKNFILLLNFILLPSASVHTLAQEAYAVMSKDSTTLTFYYDNLKASREGTKFELNIGAERPDWVKVVKEERIELAENPNFKTVVFDNSFKDARPCSCAYWFAGFENLTKIEGLENLNTSKVTDMSWMFDNCRSLTHLDLSSFNTASVTDMKGMFFYCTNLTNLDVSKFNTLNVTVMGAMFWNCRSLKSLDLTNMKIVGNAENQNVSWDEHGFLCREYSDLTETYDAKQLKIINRGLYVTDDNWRTSSAGIGNFMYYDPEDGQMKEDYGVIAKTLVGNLILSEKVGVYNKNNSMVLGEDGMLITTEYDNSNTQKDIMTIRRKTVDENGQTQYERILYIDDSGNVILNGSVSITSTTSNGSATLSELTDENRWMNLISNRDSEYDKKFEDQQNTIRELTTKVDTIPGEFNIVIEEKISSIADKLDSITTSMGYTFNNDGLYIRRSGEEIANKIDNNGMYVLRFVGDTASEILTADNKGVNAVNLTARQYLSIGAHARFEDYDNGTDNKRTACYFMA